MIVTQVTMAGYRKLEEQHTFPMSVKILKRVGEIITSIISWGDRIPHTTPSVHLSSCEIERLVGCCLQTNIIPFTVFPIYDTWSPL